MTLIHLTAYTFTYSIQILPNPGAAGIVFVVGRYYCAPWDIIDLIRPHHSIPIYIFINIHVYMHYKKEQMRLKHLHIPSYILILVYSETMFFHPGTLLFPRRPLVCTPKL